MSWGWNWGETIGKNHGNKHHELGSNSYNNDFDYLFGGLEHEFSDVSCIGNNNPNWLSYFSEGLKPPNSFVFFFIGTAITSIPLNMLGYFEGLSWPKVGMAIPLNHPVLVFQFLRILNISSFHKACWWSLYSTWWLYIYIYNFPLPSFLINACMIVIRPPQQFDGEKLSTMVDASHLNTFMNSIKPQITWINACRFIY